MGTTYRMLTALVIGSLIVLILYFLAGPTLGIQIGLLIFFPFIAYWLTKHVRGLAIGLAADVHLLTYFVATRIGIPSISAAILVGHVFLGTVITLAICSEVTMYPQMQNRLRAFYALVLRIAGVHRLRQVIRGGRVVSPDSSLGPVLGPCMVVVGDGNAAVMEKGGKLTRVVGPGSIMTDPWEVVREVVDLTLQQDTFVVKDTFTRDRIPLHVELDMFYRIHVDPRALKEAGKYEFREETVLKAVCAVSDWKKATRVNAASVTRDVISMYYLDDLYDPQGDYSSHERTSPRLRLQHEIQNRLNNLMAECGVRTERVSIGRIDAPEEVKTTMLNKWKAEWEKQATISRGEGEAAVYELMEKARAEAQVQMIVAITQAFHQARASGADVPASLVLLRFIEAMETLANDPSTKILLSPSVFDTLQDIRQTFALPG